LHLNCRGFTLKITFRFPIGKSLTKCPWFWWTRGLNRPQCRQIAVFVSAWSFKN
jgi:hypothetical protein